MFLCFSETQFQHFIGTSSFVFHTVSCFIHSQTCHVEGQGLPASSGYRRDFCCPSAVSYRRGNSALAAKTTTIYWGVQSKGLSASTLERMGNFSVDKNVRSLALRFSPWDLEQIICSRAQFKLQSNTACDAPQQMPSDSDQKSFVSVAFISSLGKFKSFRQPTEAMKNNNMLGMNDTEH